MKNKKKTSKNTIWLNFLKSIKEEIIKQRKLRNL